MKLIQIRNWLISDDHVDLLRAPLVPRSIKRSSYEFRLSLFVKLKCFPLMLAIIEWGRMRSTIATVSMPPSIDPEVT